MNGSMVFIILFVFLMVSLLLVAAIFFAADEFGSRRNWAVRGDNGKIAWSQVDAGRFLLHFMTKIWLVLLFSSFISLIF